MNTYTEKEIECLRANRSALLSVAKGEHLGRGSACTKKIGIELERIIIDPKNHQTITYLSKPGIKDLFEIWSKRVEKAELNIVDSKLLGFNSSVKLKSGEEIGFAISLEPGSQFEVSVGPAISVVDLLQAIELFDDDFNLCCDMLGVNWQLVALGTNPLVSSPTSVPLLPKKRYELMDAYLSKRGVYAQDMMRISASTQISIDFCSEENFEEAYKLSVALAPILMFLCDNVSKWRGLSTCDTPRMVRSRIWREVDNDRCGTVPLTFSSDFSFETYIDWIMSVKPILFTDDRGETYSVNGATARDIMALKKLSTGELNHLLSMVFPNSRIKGFIEIRGADSMPPRLACALAAFIKGIFYDEAILKRSYDLLCTGRVDSDIPAAFEALQRDGWGAYVYGIPISTIVNALIQYCENGLKDQNERNIFHGLSSLWQQHLVPRDLYSDK